MKCVLVIILGGGAGICFYFLIKFRVKFVVFLVGKYCFIDIFVSNCINLEIVKIYVFI